MDDLEVCEPERLVSRARAAGLRGRGGGWFPVAAKWQAVRAEGGSPVVVANGAEGEPGSIKDRFVMLARTGDLLAGLALAARAVGASEAILYLKGSFAEPAAALQAALGSRSAPLAIRVHRGDDSYVGGEETAVLESLEGRRAWPRPKPPLPAAVGLGGRPTLVQNVETLCRLPAALRDPEAFRASEKTLVSLWGHVARPGVYEVALGTPVREVIERHGGGAPDGIGLVLPAGPSGSPLSPDDLDLPLDPDRLRSRGSALGTASLLVIREPACPVAVATSLAGFFEREACGQCPPCVVGTASLARTLRALESGRARPRDLVALREAAGFMSGHGYCAHGRTGAAAVTGFLGLFRAEVERHLSAGRCPRPKDRPDPFAPDSPERAGIETALAAALPEAAR